MIAYLLDTNHVSAILKGHRVLNQKMDDAEAGASFGVSIPSLAELWYMVFNSDRIEKNTTDLSGELNKLRPWEFGEAAAKEFGRIKAQLRRSGRPVPDFDVQIAAVARVNDLVLLTADGHFNHIPDLNVENWLI